MHTAAAFRDLQEALLPSCLQDSEENLAGQEYGEE